MQTLDIRLKAGESIFTESGGMAWMTGGVEMSTDTRGGLLKGLGRSPRRRVALYDLVSLPFWRGDGCFAAESPGRILDRVKGVKNILFSGEGLFLASLRGPGKIWLQSMPLANLASKLARYLPTAKN